SRFEKYLKPDERGMTQLINEIDSLGKTHQIIVGGSSYRVIEPAATTDENGNPLPQALTKEKVDIYPVLGIDTNVIGDYRNLRRFIADLEQSRQFLIINSLQFQGEADKVRRPATGSGKTQQVQLSGPEAIPVSLKIELDTYFQKPSNKSR
ncbi:MAG: type II secretion system protein M, partial [Acidobacteria bacterium]|nr:type II secretion system protein M [Acidobacteriota bacterium]